MSALTYDDMRAAERELVDAFHVAYDSGSEVLSIGELAKLTSWDNLPGHVCAGGCYICKAQARVAKSKVSATLVRLLQTGWVTRLAEGLYGLLIVLPLEDEADPAPALLPVDEPVTCVDNHPEEPGKATEIVKTESDDYVEVAEAELAGPVLTAAITDRATTTLARGCKPTPLTREQAGMLADVGQLVARTGDREAAAVIAKVKRPDCMFYNGCIDQALVGDWPGFGCHQCTAYAATEDQETKYSDILSLLAVRKASDMIAEHGKIQRIRGMKPGVDAKVNRHTDDEDEEELVELEEVG